MTVKYKIVPYIKIEVEDPELFDSLSEALEAKRHCQAMQHENYYEIEEVAVED